MRDLFGERFLRAVLAVVNVQFLQTQHAWRDDALDVHAIDADEIVVVVICLNLLLKESTTR